MRKPFTIAQLPNVASVTCNACKETLTVYGTDRQAKHKVSSFYGRHQHAHTAPEKDETNESM